MRQPVEINLEELDAVLDRARREPLSEPDYQKLKTALHALAGLVAPARTTEKRKSALREAKNAPSSSEEKPTEKNLRRQGTDAMARSPIAGRTKSKFRMLP